MKNLYELADANDNSMAVKLLKDAGEFEGIVFRYGQIKMADHENEDGTYTLTFDWDLIEYNDIPKDELDKEKMSDIITTILEDLLTKAVNQLEGLNIGTENRKDNLIPVPLQ